jgi:predicted nucleotidyltransferase component of viral defense system
MIPSPMIEKWRRVANWPQDYQVEQDLIISRALVEIFNHTYLKDKIAFRGGTALNKIVLPKAIRYSEDIDLNRLENSPVGPLIDGFREALNEMLGKPSKIKKTANSVKILYEYQSIENKKNRLKIEINVRETLPLMPLIHCPFTVSSEYFQGSTSIVAFDTEEMIATKIRALYQRNKGRDLFDLYELSKMNLNWDNIVSNFKLLKIGASAKQFESNLALKMENNEFLEDILPLLPNKYSYNAHEAYEWFFREIIPRMAD